MELVTVKSLKTSHITMKEGDFAPVKWFLVVVMCGRNVTVKTTLRDLFVSSGGYEQMPGLVTVL